MVTRRHVIRNLVVSVGGSSLLSACGGRVTFDTLAPTAADAPPRFYRDREMALLSRVSDLLLPRTETPGALDVGVPGILDGLMAEWANDETRGEHRAAIASLDAALRARVGGDFLAAGDVDAERALAAVDAEAFDAEASESEGVEGWRGLKSLISQAYFSTEAGAVQEQGWVAVPGRWDPCVVRGGA